MRDTQAKTVVCALILIASFIVAPWGAVKGHCRESMDAIAELRQIERDNIQVDVQSIDYFGYMKGSIPVLISAPHGAKHYRAREKRWKAQDAYTSALAIKLGRLTGAHVIFTKNKTLEDPNSALTCRYKDFLAKVVKDNNIKFVMDIHGASAGKPFKLDVGVLDGRPGKSSCPTFKPIIERALQDFDRGVFNKHFRARDPATITHFAWKRLKVESAQFEINAAYRNIGWSGACSDADRARVRELIGRLQQVICDINRKISP